MTIQHTPRSPHDAVTGEVLTVPRGSSAGTIVRQDFNGTSIETRAETASGALAAQARAQVESRYIMAMQRPRDLEVSRQRMLRDCARPAFAKSAIYRKPVGDGIEGPSIRFAEAAARALGNIDTGVVTVFEDLSKRIVQVSATDLEANLTYPMTVVVEKTVERSKVREGQRVIAARTNSRGAPVYIVEATDDDILNKSAALISKALRTCLLRLIPGDIIDEAMAACYRTMENEAAEDPDASIRAMVDAFAVINVSAAQLADYLGHPVAETSPKETVGLKAIYTTIRDGEASWQETLEHRRGQRGQDDGAGRSSAQAPAAKAAPATTPPAAAPAAPPARGKGRVDLQAEAANARAKREAAQPPAAPGPQTTLPHAGPPLVEREPGMDDD